jgi:Sec-independent protein translocase protein TatA
MLHVVPKTARALQKGVKDLKEATNEAIEREKAAEKERLELKKERELRVKQLVEMKQARKAYGVETPEQDPISVGVRAFLDVWILLTGF